MYPILLRFLQFIGRVRAQSPRTDETGTERPRSIVPSVELGIYFVLQFSVIVLYNNYLPSSVKIETYDVAL